MNPDDSGTKTRAIFTLLGVFAILLGGWLLLLQVTAVYMEGPLRATPT